MTERRALVKRSTNYDSWGIRSAPAHKRAKIHSFANVKDRSNHNHVLQQSWN